MSIIVTGGAGFIGSNFIHHLIKTVDDEIVCIDKLTYAANRKNIPTKVKLYATDIANEQNCEYIFKKYKPSIVFHFAAESHVDNSIKNCLPFIHTNITGTVNLLNLSLKYDIQKFIHVSTDEIYGSIEDGYFTEQSNYSPRNPYSASKAAAEMIVMSYIESFNMNIKIVSCNNVYGPNQYPEKLIPKFIRLLKNNEKCTIHGTNSANVRRAFMHVEDVVDAVEVVWKRGIRGEVYNIASDDELSVMDVTKLIIKTLKNTEDYDEWIDYIEDRPFNDQRYYICANKLKALGWSQKRTREDLIKYIQH